MLALISINLALTVARNRSGSVVITDGVTIVILAAACSAAMVCD
jgi:hypothetical protein